MITVVVYINERPVLARSARRVVDGSETTLAGYRCDDGRMIYHDPKKGFTPLAIEMLAKTTNIDEPLS